MNILNKNNKLNHRYSYDELIIKKGIFMLPNSLLILNNNSKIIFRDTTNNIDEDLNLKIINLVNSSLINLSFLPESSLLPFKNTHLVNKLYIDNLIKTNTISFTKQFKDLDKKIDEILIEINNKVAIKNENNIFTKSNEFNNLYLSFDPVDSNHATRKLYVDNQLNFKQSLLDNSSSLDISNLTSSSLNINSSTILNGSININNIESSFNSNVILNAPNFNITNTDTDTDTDISNSNYATKKSYVDNKINKIGFISTCEAEGLLEENSYPFCFGNGSPSDENFGLPIPFSYTLRGIAWSIYLIDTTEPIIYIQLIHYPSDGSVSTILYTNSEENKLIGKTGEKKNINIASNSPGNLVVKFVSSSGITDTNSKFRLSFVLTFDDNIYS